MGEHILEIKKLSKSFGEHIVLCNINLCIEKKDVYGILGLSGAGKSTLIRCINGLEKFDEGEIIFKGKKVLFDRNYRKNVGIVVFNQNKKVLMCARADSDDFNWQFPQGGIDEKEDIVTAAKRELFEETGIKSVSLIAKYPEPLRYDFISNSF